MAVGDFSIYAGKGMSKIFTVTDADGNAIDITGATVKFMVKASASDDDSAAVIAKEGSVTDGPAGKALVTLTAEETDQTPGTYLYDVQITPLGGTPLVAQRKITLLTPVRKGA